MNRDVKILDQKGNILVLHLSDRRFPGVMIQGDTMANLFKDIREIIEETSRQIEVRKVEEIDSVMERLDDIQSFFEYVCSKNGIGLPY